MTKIHWTETTHPFITYTKDLVNSELQSIGDEMECEENTINIEVEEHPDGGDCLPTTTTYTIKLGLPYLSFIWGVCANLYSHLYHGRMTEPCGFRQIEQIYKYAVFSSLAHELGHRLLNHNEAPNIDNEQAADEFAFKYICASTSEYSFLGALADLSSLLLLDVILHRSLNTQYKNHPTTLSRIEALLNTYESRNFTDTEKEAIKYVFCILERVHRRIAKEKQKYTKIQALTTHDWEGPLDQLDEY